MSFTSVVFLVFLALFFLAWPWLRQADGRRWFGLTACSLVFYGWWDWRFAFLLLATGLLDFAAAWWMTSEPRFRRPLLWLSIGSNVGLLLFFKYTAFIAEESSLLFGWPDDDALLAAQSIILPVGISFYTFQSMSYTIDVYRGEITPTRNPFHFLAYLSLFPQLVAGPIIRAADLLPQLKTAGDYTAANRWLGLERIAVGFFKKVVIADNLAPLVNELFLPATTSTMNGASAWLGAVLFGVQILCDFSGYSDIAIGIARWMGYSFPENFIRPYSAIGAREFWSRWHISLSTWFRDYVYVPLGGSRTTPLRNAQNLWLTMLLSGLWHGANATFIAWGALHASFLSVERVTRWPERLKAHPLLRGFGWLFTFAAVSFAWVFFRAESLPQACMMARAMLTSPLNGSGGLLALMQPSTWIAVGGFALVALGARLTTSEMAVRPSVRITCTVAALVAAVFLRGPGNAFIYFQF